MLFLGLHAAEPAHAATPSFTVNWKKTRTFIIQFFSNPPIDPLSTEPYEGKTFLGEILVQTDRQGKVKSETGTFSFSPFQKVPLGQFITATATNKSTGDTSEFSQAKPAERPPIGP